MSDKAWKTLSGDRYLELGRERKGGRGWGAVGGGQDQKYLMPTVALGNPPFQFFSFFSCFFLLACIPFETFSSPLNTKYVAPPQLAYNSSLVDHFQLLRPQVSCLSQKILLSAPNPDFFSLPFSFFPPHPPPKVEIVLAGYM